MNRKDLANFVSGHTGMSKKHSNALLADLFNHIGEAVKAGESVFLKDFGTFKLTVTKARSGNAPNGRPFSKPAGKKVSFKASTALKG